MKPKWEVRLARGLDKIVKFWKARQRNLKMMETGEPEKD